MQEKKDAEKNRQKPKPSSPEEIKYFNSLYILSFRKNRVDHFMFLSFARINNNMFAQFEPLAAEEESKGSFAAGLKMHGDTPDKALWEPGNDHTFSFAKVRTNAGQLEFIPLDEDYMQEMLDRGAMAIPFEKDDWFDTKLITASPNQLQKFFHKYGDDERVFNKRYTLVLKQAAL